MKTGYKYSFFTFQIKHPIGNIYYHVSDAIERERHIKFQLSKFQLDAVFINEGDKKDLTTFILQQYFSGSMQKVSAATSCAYKHLLSYQKLLKTNEDVCLVLEDDVILYKNFASKISEILAEIKKEKMSGFIISLEDSALEYVGGRELKKGILLYEKSRGRMTGAYLIDQLAAKNILEFIEDEKCALPIDWFHNLYAKKGLLKIYWSHPTIAVQGSLDGSITSLIDHKATRYLRRFFLACKGFIRKSYIVFDSYFFNFFIRENLLKSAIQRSSFSLILIFSCFVLSPKPQR